MCCSNLNWYHAISHATAEVLYKTPLLQLGSTIIQKVGDGPLQHFNNIISNGKGGKKDIFLVAKPNGWQALKATHIYVHVDVQF